MSTPNPNSVALFKQNILIALTHHLYEPVRQRHHKLLEDLILKNTQLMKSGTRAFRYKGDLYRSDEAPRGPLLSPKLHADLEPELVEMLREQQEIRSIEEPMVKGYITMVLNLSANIDDYLLLFPPSVHQPILSLGQSSQGERKFPTEAHAALLLQKCASSIALMKERMATNLLFQ